MEVCENSISKPNVSQVISYIGLGANLGEAEKVIKRAIGDLKSLPNAKLIDQSPLYASTPLGPPNQPWYINAVAKLMTGLPPLELLDQLQRIEETHGRTRNGLRWAPRTLDLDILLYGEQIISKPRLTIPHPEMTKRNFVIKPLHDIAPELSLPDGRSVSSVLGELPDTGLRLL